MTFILLLFLLLLFSVLTWICYLITRAIINIVSKLANSSSAVNMKVIFVISLFLAGLTTYFFLFTTPATNYNTAFIDKYEKGYKVTVKGKRVLMANDPVSAFLRKTYEDSIVFIIPKNDGVIQSNEIQISQDRYKPTGTITIKEQKMTIALYYDDKQTDADTWNGKYNLILK